MKRHNTILAGAGALMMLGGLLAGCAHQAAPPLAAPAAPTASQHTMTPEETAAMAKAHGFAPPKNTGSPGTR
jgi:hypothetical protein